MIAFLILFNLLVNLALELLKPVYSGSRGYSAEYNRICIFIVENESFSPEIVFK